MNRDLLTGILLTLVAVLLLQHFSRPTPVAAQRSFGEQPVSHWFVDDKFAIYTTTFNTDDRNGWYALYVERDTGKVWRRDGDKWKEMKK